MNELDPATIQASYLTLRTWYLSEGRAIVKRNAEEAREAGRALSSSLVVDPRVLDEPVTY